MTRPRVMEDTMTLTATHPAARAIENYIGRSLVMVACVADPVVENTFAFRVTYAGDQRDEQIDLLVTRVPLNEVSPDDLEEVQFTAWPPTSADRPTTFVIEGGRR